MAAFFGEQCGDVAAGLHVLPPAEITLKLGEFHDFHFDAELGMQYTVDLRVGEGSGEEFVSAIGSHLPALGDLVSLRPV